MANEYNSKVVLADGTVLMDLTADTVDAAHLLAPYTAHGRDGAPITGACTYDADTSDATAAVGEILTTKTAYVNGVKLIGTMPNRGAVTGTISTKAQEYTVPQGYHDGSGKVKIADAEQAKIIATNIREGITILGVEGSMSGSEGMAPQAKTFTPLIGLQPTVIAPDTGYNCLSQVTVNPITITYSDNPQGGKTVTIGAVA